VVREGKTAAAMEATKGCMLSQPDRAKDHQQQ
jgi:hypothetical protein